MRETLVLTLFLAVDAFAVLLAARCLLQYGRLHFLHPLAQFCSRSTNWLVRPLRRAVPPVGRWDTACAVGVLLVYFLVHTTVMLTGLPEVAASPRLVAANAVLSILGLTKAAAYALLGGLVWRMVLTLSNPYSPLMPVLQRIYLPLCRPLVFLRFGRWDFSGSLLALLLWWWIVWWLPQAKMKLHLLLLQ